MKLWRLTVYNKTVNAPLINSVSYYCGTFEQVSEYIYQQEKFKFLEEGSIKTHGETWTLREVKDFTLLGEQPVESLQTNIVD